ncbi:MULTISPECIES: hypothetical protein [unclassified Burkholderia]|uniref:hypothetical protein n=1 Tax=unclassified Burkholderia TaxID=2613784 RepID=UPI001E51754D|nr:MULTISPECIES: hypothetical protein [unclassified Burkholderia]UEP29771.1 hypothetical protein LMA01_25490 [Burkholderia sp. B21-007]UEP44916.1 hypothetical protein LMA02_19290 [Burkholderia sp. B21-005]
MKRFLSAAARIDPANAGGGMPSAPGKLSGSSARLVRQGAAAAQPRPPARDMFQFRNFLRVPPDPAAGLSDESLVQPASSEAGPLLAQIEVRETTTWRPAGSAANPARAGKDAVHGDDRRDGQHCLVPTGTGRRRRIVGAPAMSGCRHKQRLEYGVEK